MGDVSAAPTGARGAISGTTRLFAVLGDPVTQVRAPALLNGLFARTGRDAVLVPVQAGPGDLPAVARGLMRARNLDGLLVTVPHKAAMLALADEVSPAAALSGTTNALRRTAHGRWHADNFDGAGFLRGLTAAGRSPAGLRVLLAGAGGAGSAIAVALLRAGAAALTVCDPDRARREALAARLAEHWPGRVRTGPPAGPGEPLAADLAVNATPLGMRRSDPLPFDPAGLPPHAVVADIVMKPARTRLLARAAALGLGVQPGAPMLDHQLDLYRDYFDLNHLVGERGDHSADDADDPLLAR
ncbi:shikimate dehydrogenase family protein [Streptomyces carpaticus]|uniref:Shikimate dehydrogenase n=1 Tax=Streptomyces carpaticus TaxID=285558 RepID=A0ABV4ZSX5_9ACTN